MKKNSFKIQLKDDCKILIINEYNDINKIPIIIEKDSSIIFKKYDFETLSKTYDCIWLTEKGECETHFLPYPNFSNDLYGWDCESLLIMNPTCFIELNRKNKKYEHIKRNI